TFVGNVTKEDLIAFTKDMDAMVKEGQEPVYHISNSLQLTKVELSLPALFSVIKSIGTLRSLAWQIDVNLNPTNKMLASLSTQLMRIQTRTMPTLYEAVSFLKNVDETLQTATWNIPTPAEIKP
ncbi:MAG TPA: hypothetical protein PLZ51_08650, partial [Aggregatilineales bacterium]|nr:hypothetical protein [Aggregatilineales bacterium]